MISLSQQNQLDRSEHAAKSHRHRRAYPSHQGIAVFSGRQSAAAAAAAAAPRPSESLGYKTLERRDGAILTRRLLSRGFL